MQADALSSPTTALRWLVRLIHGWALFGGFVLLAVVLMTTVSAFTGFVFATPFPGDFELTEMGVAVAAFAFLPYCQLTFSNVSADIFTQKAGPAVNRWLSRLGSLIALCFSVLLMWRMFEGLKDYQTYLETTTILQIPIWYAFVPTLASLALLALAAIVTMVYPEGGDTPAPH
ncbi:MAG: TRAP transporter small permease [Gammaproteobacteria bacterium]|nr:TRAP transporter small permease [Gammaproteobacteria bacterium]